MFLQLLKVQALGNHQRRMFQQSIARGSVGQLFPGFTAVVLFVVPGQSLYFGGYELGREVLPSSWGPGQDFGAGAIAQLCGGLMFTPMDVIKERRQAAGVLTGTNQGIREIISGLGLKGLMRGYWLSNALWVPWSMIYAGVYGHFKSSLEAGYSIEECSGGMQEQSQQLSAAGTALCSSSAAVIASVVTHPLDVIKTQVQVLPGTPGHLVKATAADFLRSLWVQEGWQGLRRGLGARILTIAPQTALGWTLYEGVKGFVKET